MRPAAALEQAQRHSSRGRRTTTTKREAHFCLKRAQRSVTNKFVHIVFSKVPKKFGEWTRAAQRLVHKSGSRTFRSYLTEYFQPQKCENTRRRRATELMIYFTSAIVCSGRSCALGALSFERTRVRGARGEEISSIFFQSNH